jgi:hypothetical protein
MWTRCVWPLWYLKVCWDPCAKRSSIFACYNFCKHTINHNGIVLFLLHSPQHISAPTGHPQVEHNFSHFYYGWVHPVAHVTMNEYNNPSFATMFQRPLLNTCITTCFGPRGPYVCVYIIWICARWGRHELSYSMESLLHADPYFYGLFSVFYYFLYNAIIDM